MNTPLQPTKYFLYIRKSTDEEDRQVLSLEAQLHEAKEFAEHEGIEIVESFIEKKTAKVPGRPIFNSMLNKIDGGLPHLIGILAWHPDRLSRNSVDGGRLIYLLDTGKLGGLKFPTFAFENNPSGKFFLAIGLSNAKYYVDNLAENVRRGNRAKLRRGEWPGQKPFGYIYDHRLRNIVPEPKEAKIVKKIYEEFATGRHTLKSISARLAELGGGKARSNYSIENLLTNDRY
ncbi:MAG: Recombinase, partial [Candidatus Jorgensenbacteria bacterium GW2011_GWA2_45_9]